MNQDKTFDLEDLTDYFWKKVVFFELCHSSGLGGPGALWMVTEDKKKYYLGFEDLPFSEDNLCAMLSRYKKEDDDWHDIHGLPFHTMGALVRGDIYENFNRIARDENLVKEKVDFGYYNLSDIVGLALGTESLERINYICSVRAQEKEARLRKERNEERERNKFLPEHLVWKPMHKNNMKANSVFGEYALLITRKEEKLVAMEFKIVFQEHMKKPMLLDIAKGTDYYVLFEKTDHDFYGPIDYPSPEDKWGNSEEDCRTSKHESSFFDRYLSGNKDMGDYGRFLRAFSTEEAAKEYAVCYANANSHIIGDRNSLITHLDSEEDHRRRVERYEAYQAYRKYYK